MRINFGCGRQVWEGWVNVDAQHHPRASRAPDLLHALAFDAAGALINPLPLDSGCAEELCAMHVIEHVYAWEAPALVGEWRRLLRPGGRLVLELPNLELAARNLLNGTPDQMSMWPLYGDPAPKDPFNCHRWGYTPQSIKALLLSAGFEQIEHRPPETHGARVDRDMRVEARK